MFWVKCKDKWIVTIILFFIVMLPLISSSQELIWATDNTPGGYYINGGGTTFNEEKPGIEIELYQMVGQKLGLTIVFKRYPWNRCLELIQKNKVDGVFPASFKEERMKIGVYPMSAGKIDPSKKSRDNAYFLYKLRSDPITWNGQNFINNIGSIGAPFGWAIVDDLKKKNISVIELPINTNTVNLLIHKRLQGFVCLETVFDSYIHNNFKEFSNIVKVTPPIWEKPYYLMLSHQFVVGNLKSAETIWNTIRDIKKSNGFKNLIKKYTD